jgi:hypothetical protein
VLLVLTPGPNLLYLMSRTLAQGRAAGLVSMAGTTTGFVVHIVAASLGLSAVFVAVPIAYDAVRWAGAGYLLWLAWDSIRSGADGGAGGIFAPRALPRAGPAKLLGWDSSQAILNPKLRSSTLRSSRSSSSPRAAACSRSRSCWVSCRSSLPVIGDTLFILAAARVIALARRAPAVGVRAALAAGERLRGHRREARARRPAMTIPVAARAALRAWIRMSGA